jgi:dTDP-4-dehydrorhamnose reductase
MKILITGGSGLLGQEILKLDQSLIAPLQYELDITNLDSVKPALEKHQPNIVLHLAAATKPPEHEKDPKKGLEVNIAGTTNIALACLEHNIRLVFTSSDYLYTGPGAHKESEPVSAPNNFYLSKLAGECAVRLCPNSLVLRLSFGPVPYPWEKVYDNQINNKLYVDEMAPLVLTAAKSLATGIMNLGGPRTTLEDYAQRTKPNIETMPNPDWLPEDLSLDLTKMQKELGIKDLDSLLKHR